MDKDVIHYVPGHLPSHQKVQRKNTVTKMAILEPIYIVVVTLGLFQTHTASETASDCLNIHGFLRPCVAVQCEGVIVWSVDQGSYKSLLVLGLRVVGG